MIRRHFLRIALGGTAWLALSGHTPYRHWQVYRQKHLLIGSCKADPQSYSLALSVAETLVRELPQSSARASRAPDQRRIASLLASDQWQVSVLRTNEAADLAAGRGMFETVDMVPLRGLFALGEHTLVCRPDFPDRHAWLVTATLTEAASAIPGGTPVEPDQVIPSHPGAQAYAAGRPLPPAPANKATGSEADHGHAH